MIIDVVDQISFNFVKRQPVLVFEFLIGKCSPADREKWITWLNTWRVYIGLIVDLIF